MENLIYLDNAATSYPKPEEVYTFMDSFYRDFGVNPGRSGYDLCMETGALVDQSRKMLADFFNGNDSNRLCFSYNSTDALNLAIFGMLKQGDHAITTTLEHNSVLRPLYHLSKLNGVEVDYIPFDTNGFVDPDDFKRKIKANTRLVIINHASNVIGTVQPVEAIGRICRECGVALALDASQSAGTKCRLTLSNRTSISLRLRAINRCWGRPASAAFMSERESIFGIPARAEQASDLLSVCTWTNILTGLNTVQAMSWASPDCMPA